MNKSINFIKCIAAFCVICMHCELHNYGGKIGTLIIGVMRFAVPIFFLISGYYSCSKEKSGEKNIKKYKRRIIKLVKLIVISGVVYLLLDIFVLKKYTSVSQYINVKWNPGNIFKYVMFNVSPFAGHLWFLSALIYCYITVAVIEKLNLKVNLLYKYIPILLLVNIIFGEMSKYIGLSVQSSIYYRNFIFYALPFFLMGYAIKDKWQIFDKISNKTLIIVNVLSIILIIIEVLGTKNADLYVGNIFQAITMLIWCIKNPNVLNIKIFDYIGGYIYTNIYIYHLMVLEVLKLYQKSLGKSFESRCYIDTIIVFVITIIISTIIYYFGKLLKNLFKSTNKFNRGVVS